MYKYLTICIFVLSLEAPGISGVFLRAFPKKNGRDSNSFSFIWALFGQAVVLPWWWFGMF
jgi:hypothetical protein